MSYRFLKITTFYPEYLDSYYRRNPKVKDLSYAEQKSHLMAEGYGWADHFEKNLRSLGVDAHEIVANANYLQQQWAAEHSRNISGRDIVLAQIADLNPDVLMFQDTFYATGGWIALVRERTPSIKQVIGWCSAPFSERHLGNLKAYDYILACSPYFVQYFAMNGITSYLMYHAFEPRLLPLLDRDNDFPAVDLIFLGSLAGGEGYHNKRLHIIENLIMQGVEPNIYTHLQTPSRLTTTVQQGIYFAAKAFNALGFGSTVSKLPILHQYHARTSLPRHPSFSKALRTRVRPPEYGVNMLKALSRAKIGLNSHIDVAGEYAGNSRLFEVTGVGSCLVTDWKINIRDLFMPDKEIITYRSAKECIEKITWLLRNPVSLKDIGRAGQIRTLRDHTFLNRALQIDDIIKKEFGCHRKYGNSNAQQRCDPEHTRPSHANKPELSKG